MSKVFEDHYGILGIDQKATPTQIRTAYLKLMKQCHPDKNPRQSAQQLEYCKKVIKAYSVVSDPAKRRAYDCTYNSNKNQKETHNSRSQWQEQNRNSQEQSNTSKNDRDYKQTNQNQKDTGNKDNQKNKQDQSSSKNQNQREHHKEHNSGHQRSYQNQSSDYKQTNQNQKDTGNKDNQKNKQDQSSSKNQNQREHHKEHNSGHQRSYQNQSSDNRRQQDNHRHQSGTNQSDRNSYQDQYFGRQENQNGPEHTNLYDILGVRRNATKKEIESAFRKFALRYSDSENPIVKRQFQKILGAYIVLSDPNLRANYDMETSNNNERSSTYGTFTFLRGEHFKDCLSIFDKSAINIFLHGVALVCLGGVYIIYIISKCTMIILYNVAKTVIKVLPPLLLLLGKLICIIIPPLVKGATFLIIGLAISIGFCFKTLLRCAIG